MLRQRRWAEVGLPATPAARREASSPPETADVRRSTTVGWVEQREIHHRNCFGYCFALTSLVAVPTRGMVDKRRIVHPTRRVFLRRFSSTVGRGCPGYLLFHQREAVHASRAKCPLGCLLAPESAIQAFPNPPTNSVNSAVDNLCKSPLRLAFKRVSAGRSVFAQ